MHSGIGITLKSAGIELPVEKLLSLIRDSVKPTRKALGETVINEDREAVARGPSCTDPLIFQRLSCHIPVNSHLLKDVFIDWMHPLGPLSHSNRCCECYQQSGNDVSSYCG